MALMRSLSSIQNDLNRLFYEMDREFFAPLVSSNRGLLREGQDEFLSSWTPRVNVIHDDEKHEVRIEALLPGYKPEEVELDISENNVLTISGKMSRKEEEKKKNYRCQEIIEGNVYRQIPLEVEVDADKAHARYENGKLMVTIPMKQEQTKRHKIKINR
jgi:HSP20 family protein